VRLSYAGRLFEELHTDTTAAQPRWQLRIPLPDSQYVNFYRGFDSQMDPLAISAFVQAVQSGLKTRALTVASDTPAVDEALVTGVIQMPERFFAAKAAVQATAGAAEPQRVAR
jgi:hypothetical protein